MNPDNVSYLVKLCRCAHFGLEHDGPDGRCDSCGCVEFRHDAHQRVTT